jgi:hypothetical protein
MRHQCLKARRSESNDLKMKQKKRWRGRPQSFAKDIWGTTQQAEPIQEEVNRFLLYRNDPRMDLNVEIATLSVETSEASRPTSL